MSVDIVVVLNHKFLLKAHRFILWGKKKASFGILIILVPKYKIWIDNTMRYFSSETESMYYGKYFLA